MLGGCPTEAPCRQSTRPVAAALAVGVQRGYLEPGCPQDAGNHRRLGSLSPEARCTHLLFLSPFRACSGWLLRRGSYSTQSLLLRNIPRPTQPCWPCAQLSMILYGKQVGSSRGQACKEGRALQPYCGHSCLGGSFVLAVTVTMVKAWASCLQGWGPFPVRLLAGGSSPLPGLRPGL